MEIEEIRKKIADKYLEYDKKSGHLFLLSVLFEEVGELAEAVRKREIESIEEELADSLFMILSIANLFNVNPEKKLYEKYVKGNPSHRWDLP